MNFGWILEPQLTGSLNSSRHDSNSASLKTALNSHDCKHTWIVLAWMAVHTHLWEVGVFGKRAGRFQNTLGSFNVYHGLASTNQINRRRTSRQIKSLPQPVEGRAKTSDTLWKVVLRSSLNEVNCRALMWLMLQQPLQHPEQLPRRAKFTAAITQIFFFRTLFIISVGNFKLWQLFRPESHFMCSCCDAFYPLNSNEKLWSSIIEIILKKHPQLSLCLTWPPFWTCLWLYLRVVK